MNIINKVNWYKVFHPVRYNYDEQIEFLKQQLSTVQRKYDIIVEQLLQSKNSTPIRIRKEIDDSKIEPKIIGWDDYRNYRKTLTIEDDFPLPFNVETDKLNNSNSATKEN